MKKRYIVLPHALFLALGLAVAAIAANGQLDTTYGLNGKIITAVYGGTSLVNAVVVQPDGKVVAVGSGGASFGIRRFNADGSPDGAFNANIDSAVQQGEAYAVAIQSDGKIIVAGDNGNPANIDIKLVRLNSNGTLDTSFDGDGVLVMPVGPATDIALAIAIQPDGKILVSGRSDSNPTFVTTWMLLRFNSNGSLDTSFDGDGIVTPPLRGNAITDAMSLQPDGKIVLAHNSWTGSAYILAFNRFNSDGSLDSSFGTNGIAEVNVSQNVEQVSLALQTDGKVVAACSGYTNNARGYDFWVVRYNSDGSPDGSFGTDGKVVTSIGPGGEFDVAKTVAIQANGKIVVGGSTQSGTSKNFAIVRYNRNGSLDEKFGIHGIVNSDLGGAAESVNAIAIQSNGRIVAAGESDAASTNTRRFALARYMGDPAENFDFDRDGNSDISVYRPSEGNWYVLGSATGSMFGVKWGIATDRPAAADYDGDLRTDYAVWRPGPFAYLYILNSSDGTIRIEQFGQTGDDPSVIADYDGDGKADPAVYRQAAVGQQSYFYYRASSNNPAGNTTYVPWGTSGDVAARGDFNGDGRFDPTVFRPSNGVWYSLNLTNSTSTVTNWGISTDELVPADYDGDGKTDYAVFRNGVWYILRSNSGNAQYEYWGLSTDILVPGDFDGDGRSDVAVFRPDTSDWYIQGSLAGTMVRHFGTAGDFPAPNAFVP